jgi:hypothetical protein
MNVIDKNRLSNILDMDHVEEANIIEYKPTNEEPEVEETTDIEKLNSDVDEARNNYHEILKSGADVLEAARKMAIASEGHPKSVEAFAIMLKNLADVNTQLIHIHEQKKKIITNKNDPAPVGGNTNINNAVFVGTMSELSKTNLVK